MNADTLVHANERSRKGDSIDRSPNALAGLALVLLAVAACLSRASTSRTFTCCRRAGAGGGGGGGCVQAWYARDITLQAAISLR